MIKGRQLFMPEKKRLTKMQYRLCIDIFIGQWEHYPTTSEASKEVANLTERKNPHTP